MSTPPIAATDCLVCLQPIKRLWTPPTTCPCKPFLHERCWNSWVRHMNEPVCVICRNIPEHRPPPVAAIMIIHQEEPVELRRLPLPFYNYAVIVCTPWITMGFIILTLIFFQIQTRRRTLTMGKLSGIPPYMFNIHDEL
jgi:hypothetical protein